MNRLFVAYPALFAVFVAPLSSQLVANGKIAPKEVVTRHWIITVFRPDGSLQCQATPSIPLEAMAKELTKNGARVLDMRKAPLAMATIAECGAPTGMVNRFTLDVTGETQINRDPIATTWYSFWPREEKTLIVSAHDGAFRCGEAGVPIEITARRLTDAGITPTEPMVIKAGLDPDRTGRCGAAIGDAHIFRIPFQHMLGMRKLKFTELASRLPSQCVGVVAPPADSIDSMRVSAPQSKKLILPIIDNIPGEMKGVPIRVTFFLNSLGTVDSIGTHPALLGGFARSMTRVMTGYHFTPPVYDGCYVAFPYKVTLTF